MKRGGKRPTGAGSFANQLTNQIPTMKITIDKSNLAVALADAIRDIAENGTATPHNPAININGEGAIQYGSALTNIYPDDFVLINLQEGVGNYECEATDDIDAVAAAWAADIVGDLQNELNEKILDAA